MGFFKNWDDWGSLERSLPVVNGEFFQKLGRLGFLRTLATGSELRFQWIFSTILGPLDALEGLLPVVNWDSNGFFKNRGALRTPATGSEFGFELIFSTIGMIGGP